MSRKTVTTLVAGIFFVAGNLSFAQVIVPGHGGPVVVPSPQPPRFIPPSQGQYPVYVTPNEVIGVNPQTGGLDTQNRQIDNTAYQYGRNESKNNGTRRWVRRPIYNSQGQVVGYQEGWVWRNTYTGQEHGDLVNYTPNGQGGVNQGHQARSVGVHKNQQSYSPQQGGTPQQGGVHKNYQSYSVQRPGVHKNIQSYSVKPSGVHKNVQHFSPSKPKSGGGVHKNIRSYSVKSAR